MSAGLEAFPVDTSADLPAWALRSLVEAIDRNLTSAERLKQQWAGMSAGAQAAGEASAFRLVLAMLSGTTTSSGSPLADRL
ncbi:hypothetical protein QOZ88_19365 [Blastococcus sp. BMG 814]|uniref:Uncharacterized protein n=1 Tax=Blastococcus carthaginiensis TaxID=3050034 RepID=A0ABT9IGV0_9ACTN|nr:hypothetical protein [Blastococcus carthaginiensis]MDP5184798.1 hypothetical protein [Blastococcus carthaginiensis]